MEVTKLVLIVTILSADTGSLPGGASQTRRAYSNVAAVIVYTSLRALNERANLVTTVLHVKPRWQKACFGEASLL